MLVFWHAALGAPLLHTTVGLGEGKHQVLGWGRHCVLVHKWGGGKGEGASTSGAGYWVEEAVCVSLCVCVCVGGEGNLNRPATRNGSRGPLWRGKPLTHYVGCVSCSSCQSIYRQSLRNTGARCAARTIAVNSLSRPRRPRQLRRRKCSPRCSSSTRRARRVSLRRGTTSRSLRRSRWVRGEIHRWVREGGGSLGEHPGSHPTEP